MGALRYTSAVVAIALMGFSVSSAAQDDAGFYIGGNFGQSDVQDFEDECDGAEALAGISAECDETDTAFKVYAGYQINQYFAAEFGYVDLGEATLNVTGPLGSAGLEFEANAFYLQAVGTIPIVGGLSILGRIGAARWDVDTRSTGLLAGLFSESDDGFSLAYGAGLQWMFTRNFGLRAEYEVFDSVGDEDTTGEGDVHMYSLGVLFKF